MSLGSGRGAHRLHKNEFRNFLKSDDSALELLELLTSTQYKYSKTFSDFVLANKIEFLRVMYIIVTISKVVKKLSLEEILEKLFRIAKNAHFRHFLAIIS